MKEFKTKGIVEKIIERIETTVTYNVALKMPTTSSYTEYDVVVDGVKYENVDLNLYPFDEKVIEGMDVKVFSDSYEVFFGDVNSSDEEIIASYEKDCSANGWSLVVFAVLFLFSLYPMYLMADLVLKMDSIWLGFFVLIVLVSVLLFGVFYISFRVYEYLKNN